MDKALICKSGELTRGKDPQIQNGRHYEIDYDIVWRNDTNLHTPRWCPQFKMADIIS